MKSLTATLTAFLLAALLATGCAKEQSATHPSSPEALGKPAAGDVLGHPGALYELLDLTGEQKAKVADILAANAPERRFGRHAAGKPCEDNGAGEPCTGKHAGRGPDGKKGGHPYFEGGGRHTGAGRTGEPCAADMKAHGEKVHAEIMAILTPAQQEKARALKAQLDAGTIPRELITLRVERLDGLLKLSDDQQKKIAALMTEKGQAILACRNECDSAASCDGSRHREIGKGYMSSLKAILTPGQWETYRAQFHRRGGHDGPGDGPEHFMRRQMDGLNLTDAQKKRIGDILREVRRDGRPERGDHDAMQAHHDAVKAKIRAVLTPEQQTKFDAMKPPMDGPHGRRGPHGCQDGGDCREKGIK